MWSEEKLNEMLTTPSEGLIEDMKRIEGDILVLGAGGKMGPTLCVLAKNAARAAGMEKRVIAVSRFSEDMKRIEGDILVLGAGGKMGPTLCVLAKNAARAAGMEKRVIAVSRFSDPMVVELLERSGVEMVSADLLERGALETLPDAPNVVYMAGKKFGTQGNEWATWAMNAWLPSRVSADLLERGALETLPDAPNVVYMAGKKFGTQGNEWATWAMNAWLPSRVAERYRNSRIVVFSSGNLYPKVPVSSGGCTEDTPVEPVGEYCMSCLGRERMFEYAARTFGTKVAVYRLNYAVDLRYGVLYDIASSLLKGEPISVATPSFNCIWQGDEPVPEGAGVQRGMHGGHAGGAGG